MPPPMTRARWLMVRGFSSQRLEQGGPGHRHPHQVFGLVRGLVVLLHVHPGILVADVGHLKQILVQAGVDQGLPEQGLVGDGGASRHHHPVEVVFLDDPGHVDLGVLGAGEQVVFHVGHVGQRLGVFRQLRHVDDAADVDAAVADEHPDAGGVFRFDVLGCGRLPGLGLGPADVPQRGAHRPGRGRRLHDRFGNVFGTLHGPADIDARTAGRHRREGRGGHKIVGVGVHLQGRSQLPGALAHLHAHGQHDQVKGLGLLDAAFIRKPDLQIAVRQGIDAVDAGPDEPHPVFVFGAVIVEFEVFAEGPHVHEEDGGIQRIRRVLLGDHRLLDGVHAADRGAVGVVFHIPGAHALEPGDLLGLGWSEGRTRWPPKGPEAERIRSNSRAVTTLGNWE